MYLGDIYPQRTIAAAFGQAAVEDVLENSCVVIRNGLETFGLVSTGSDEKAGIIGFSIDQSVVRRWEKKAGEKLFTDAISLQVVPNREFFDWLIKEEPMLNLISDREIFTWIARHLPKVE